MRSRGWGLAQEIQQLIRQSLKDLKIQVKDVGQRIEQSIGNTRSDTVQHANQGILHSSSP